MIAFFCAGCGRKFNVKPEFAGRSTRCPACKASLVVPHAAEPTVTLDADSQPDGVA